MENFPKIHYWEPSDRRRGTAGKLIDWLEWHVNALVPDNGIDSWYVPRNTHDGTAYLARDDVLPEAVHHVACYVADGTNEGRYIYVALALPEHATVQIGLAKSFGSADECWRVARLCSEALTGIFCYHAQPLLREMFMRLPRAQSWHRETTLTGRVTLRCAGDGGLEVRDADGGLLDSRKFAEPNAKHMRAAYMTDWTTVLAAQGVSVEVVESVAPQCRA